MALTKKSELIHIEAVMTGHGYPRCESITEDAQRDNYFIGIEYAEGSQIYSIYFLCGTEQKAKAAVRSLLNKTSVYDVVVYAPGHNPITWYSGKGEKFSREWVHYYK